MKTITVGKYVLSDSLIHKMNPFLKLIANMLFIFMVFIANSFILLSSILVLAIIFFVIAKLKINQLWSMLLPVLYIGFSLLIINLIVMQDGYASRIDDNSRIDYNSSGNGFIWEKFNLWIFTFSDKALIETVFISMRIYIMIIITTILTSTTKSVELTKSIEYLIFPLKLFLIPTHVIAMIISIALRFVPTLLEETQRLMKAQASRGVDFKNGNIKSKTKSLITLIVPLFVSAFAKAEDLSQAMETRGYDPNEKRTSYRKLAISNIDIPLVTFVSGILIIFVLVNQGIIISPAWFF